LNNDLSKRDFFVSFNKADRAWATWIAWVLEEAGHSVWFQDWDFRGNFVEHMNRAQRHADRTIAVLSDHYFGSDFSLAEWSSRFAQDPAMREDRLVPVKVGPLTDRGILTPIVYADLTEADEGEAQRRLLERVKKAVDASYRPKPLTRPGFPGSRAREVPSKPRFPTAENNPGLYNSRPDTPGGGSASKTTATILGLVAACVIVIVVGLWASGLFSTPSNVTARDGSVGIGGGMSGSKIIIQGPSREPGPPHQQPKQ
jgi:hypothetical protein